MSATSDRNLIFRKGVWWARFYINGADTQRSLRTNNKAEAKRRLKPLREEIERQRAEPLRGGEGRTWDEAVERWIAMDFDQLREATRKRYETSIRMMHPAFGGRRLTTINQTTVNDFILTRRRAGATPATIRRDLSAANRVFKAAKRAGWVRENPIPDEKEELTEKRDVIHPVPLRDIVAVLRAASNEMAPLIRFVAKAGCRQEEAGGLEVQHVDFQRREVTFAKTKTHAPRVITMTPSMERVLRRCIPPNAAPDRPVFMTKRGGRFQALPSRWREVMERSGAPWFRMHDLRHTYAIRWLQRGQSIYRLARHLGHTTVRTTEMYSAWLVDKPE